MSDVRDIKQLLVRLNFGEPGATDSKLGVQNLATLDEVVLLYPDAYQTNDIVWVVDERNFYTIDMTVPATPVYTVYTAGNVANVTIYYGTQNDIKLYKEGDQNYKPTTLGYKHEDAIICSRDLAISGSDDIIAWDVYEISIVGIDEFYNKVTSFAQNLSALLPIAGTTGQALTKTSGTDYDADWSDITLQSVTDKGAITTTTITAADFILGSDRRIKENIKPYVADSVPIQFRDFTLKGNGIHQVGVIADELEKTNPEFVIKGVDGGTDSVQYISLMMAKIAELEDRLKKLE